MNKHITKFKIEKRYELKEVKSIKMFMTSDGETVELPYSIVSVDYNGADLMYYNPAEVRFSIDEMEDLPF